MRNAEARRASSTANAVAATLEGLSGGLPLTAPLVRAQVAQVAERTAARLPGMGVDFLVVLDAEGLPLVAWYRGLVGLENVPPALLAKLEDAAATAGDLEAAPSVLDTLRNTGNDLLALAGLSSDTPIVAAAEVRRAGADAGLVLAGSEGRLPRGDVGWALLTALLVGLIPVLFGVLAALSLSRGIRDSILYLLRATDRISHGDLEREVELKRDDELGQIARAVERMRVSLREAMERLRRR
jgi:methyl-accepting chemotaxis protein